MDMSIHFSINCLILGSVLLMIVNAALPDIRVEINKILKKSFIEAKHRLLAETVVSDPHFHEYLEGKSVEEFQNGINAYKQFKKKLYLYYIGYIFFGKCPQLKDSMDCFAANWVKHYPKNDHSKESCIEEFKNFLSINENTKEKELMSTIERFEQGHVRLKILLRRALTSRIDLAFMKLTNPEDQAFYDKLFTAFDKGEFESSFKKFTSWRNRVLDLRKEIKHTVEELYASYQSLDYSNNK